MSRLWFGNKHLRVEIGLVLVAVLLLGASNLIYPFGKDQGEYAYIGAAMLRGEAIYKDVFNVKPPMTHVVHGISQLLFGRNMIAIRIFDYFWTAATAATIVLITNRLLKKRWLGLLAGGLFATTYYGVDFWHSAQTDGFLNLPIALSVLFLLMGFEKQQQKWFWLSGSLIAIGVLFKYPIGLMLPFAGLVILLQNGWQKRSLQQIIGLGMGFGAILVVCLGWLALRGALRDFLYIQLTYIPDYNARFLPADISYWRFTWLNAVAEWGRRPRFQYFLVLLGMEFLLLIVALIRKQPRTLTLIGLWGVAALVHLTIQNKYYGYHALPILIPQAIIVAHLFSTVTDGLKAIHPKAQWALVPLAIALPFWLIFGDVELHGHRDPDYNNRAALDILTGERTLESYYEEPRFWTHNGIFESSANMQAATYLQENSSPDERIFIWAFEPAIYYMSERESASRFIYNFPLYGSFAWEPFKNELMSELTSNPPSYILIAQQDAQPWITASQDDSMQALMKFDPLRDFVFGRYQDVATIHHFKVFKLNDSP